MEHLIDRHSLILCWACLTTNIKNHVLGGPGPNGLSWAKSLPS